MKNQHSAHLQTLGEVADIPLINIFWELHLCVCFFHLLAFQEITVKSLTEHKLKEQRLEWPHTADNADIKNQFNKVAKHTLDMRDNLFIQYSIL